MALPPPVACTSGGDNSIADYSKSLIPQVIENDLVGEIVAKMRNAGRFPH